MTAASDISLFVDAVLSPERSVAARRDILPADVAELLQLPSAATDGSVTAADNGNHQSPGCGVIPLLIRDVITHTQARQILHLELFSENLDDFLEFCDETAESEWHMLYALLFNFLRRRGGLTPLQKKSNEQISDCCFLMLHKILTVPHAQTLAAHDALRSLLKKLKLSPDNLYGPESTAHWNKIDPPLREINTTGLPDPDLVQYSDSETDEQESHAEDHDDTTDIVNRSGGASVFQQRRPPEIPDQEEAGEGESPSEPLPEDPYYYSVDSLPPEARGSLTEQEFLDVEAWFKAVPLDKNGKPLLTETIQKDHGLVAYTKRLTDAVLKKWVRQHKTGSASLADLLRFLFPDCPQRTLLKRVAGHPLTDPPSSVAEQASPTSVSSPASSASLPGRGSRGKGSPSSPTTAAAPPPLSPSAPSALPPPPPSPVFVPPRALTAALAIERLQKTGKDGPSIEYASLLYTFFQAVDFSRNGIITEEGFDAAGGLKLPGKIPSLSCNFSQFLHSALPDASVPELRALQETVVSSSRERHEKQMKFLKKDNTVFEDALKAQAAAAAAPPPPTTKGSPAPPPAPPKSKAFTLPTKTSEDGSLISSLSPAMIVELQRRADELLTDYVKSSKEQIRQERHAAKVKKVADARNHAISLQVQHLEDFKRTNVPLVFGPAAVPLPPEVAIAGFTLHAESFQFGYFLEALEWRPLAAQILQRLDLGGFAPEVFVGPFEVSKVPLNLFFHSRRWSLPYKVYRDFLTCSRRPPTGTFYEGNQIFHVKTNILRYSDVKYRFHLEGYNHGLNAPINTIVVGYAARMLDSIDELESYGWPDGWDAFSILHYGKGITQLTQYFSHDGFVTLRCEAKSFSAVGFSMSAWLVVPDFGEGFAVGAQVFHQLEDL